VSRRRRRATVTPAARRGERTPRRKPLQKRTRRTRRRIRPLRRKGEHPRRRPDEPCYKRLRQTVLEEDTVLQRPLGAALKAGERVGLVVKTLPMVK
jgi:hypothetical protein